MEEAVSIIEKVVKMLRVLAALALIVASTSVRQIRAAGCTISVNSDLADVEPLILKPGSATDANEAYYWPSSYDEVVLQENDVVVIGCPGSSVKVSGSTYSKETSQAVCKSGSFLIEGKQVFFSSISCSSKATNTAEYSGNSCHLGKREIILGYKLEGRFIKHMTVCFDDVEQNTLYSTFTISKGISGVELGYPRPNFKPGTFYSVGSNSVDNLYSRNTQRITINSLVGLPADSEKYVHSSNDYFLSRGHLTAKSDFIYGVNQDITFYFVNVAPQWQTFNGANWNVLETDIQEYVGDIKVDHVIYTGTHGYVTLPHEQTGADVNIYLYVDGNKRGLPAPELYWKLLYNPVNKSGVVFIGVNNPYLKDVQKSVICQDVSSRYNWLGWKPTDTVKGYSYACTYDDAIKVIKNIPPVDVQSLY